jgi:hypothetical protein
MSNRSVDESRDASRDIPPRTLADVEARLRLVERQGAFAPGSLGDAYLEDVTYLLEEVGRLRGAITEHRDACQPSSIPADLRLWGHLEDGGERQ